MHLRPRLATLSGQRLRRAGAQSCWALQRAGGDRPLTPSCFNAREAKGPGRDGRVLGDVAVFTVASSHGFRASWHLTFSSRDMPVGGAALSPVPLPLSSLPAGWHCSG